MKIITSFKESELRLNEDINFFLHKESGISLLNVDFFDDLNSLRLSDSWGILIRFGLARSFNFNGLSDFDLHDLLNHNWLDEVLLHNYILPNKIFFKIKFFRLALNHLVQKYLIWTDIPWVTDFVQVFLNPCLVLVRSTVVPPQNDVGLRLQLLVKVLLHQAARHSFRVQQPQWKFVFMPVTYLLHFIQDLFILSDIVIHALQIFFQFLQI